MNTLSLSHRSYSITSRYNEDTGFWEVEFINDSVGDTDHHYHLSRQDAVNLRDNAKRIYNALSESLEQQDESE